MDSRSARNGSPYCQRWAEKFLCSTSENPAGKSVHVKRSFKAISKATILVDELVGIIEKISQNTFAKIA